MRNKTGHALVGSFKHRYNADYNPNCTHCGVLEDINHFLSYEHNGVMGNITETNYIKALKCPTTLAQIANTIIRLNIKI